MIPPPKKVWNRFASKVISKLGRFPRPSEAITRTTRRFLGRLGTADPDGRRCCRCSCHHQPEYWLQAVQYRSFWNNNSKNNMEVELEDDQGDGNGDQGLELVEDLMEDHAVDERAEEFIAKFHESLKLERLQHF